MCMLLVMYSHQSLSALHIHTLANYSILYTSSSIELAIVSTSIYIDIHKRGQICVVGGKPEATTIKNIELSLFLCSLIDYLDWQARNICMGALGGNASGNRQ